VDFGAEPFFPLGIDVGADTANFEKKNDFVYDNNRKLERKQSEAIFFTPPFRRSQNPITCNSPVSKDKEKKQKLTFFPNSSLKSLRFQREQSWVCFPFLRQTEQLGTIPYKKGWRVSKQGVRSMRVDSVGERGIINSVYKFEKEGRRNSRFI